MFLLFGVSRPIASSTTEDTRGKSSSRPLVSFRRATIALDLPYQPPGQASIPKSLNPFIVIYRSGQKHQKTTIALCARSVGAFGYFPSYTLGAVMACQFLEAARKELPDLDSSLKAGDFGPLKSWLNREVGSGGHLFTVPRRLTKGLSCGLPGRVVCRRSCSGFALFRSHFCT